MSESDWTAANFTFWFLEMVAFTLVLAAGDQLQSGHLKASGWYLLGGIGAGLIGWRFKMPWASRSASVEAPVQLTNHCQLQIESIKCNRMDMIAGPVTIQGVPIRHMWFAILTVKNDSSGVGQPAVAKGITAHLVYRDAFGQHLKTVHGLWDPDAGPGGLSNFDGGGQNVWFDVGQRRTLTIAVKDVADDSCYAVTKQPHVPNPYVKAPGLELPKGAYGVTVELRSAVSPIHADLSLKLTNLGRNDGLELAVVSAQ
jgi:hypothetical protein